MIKSFYSSIVQFQLFFIVALIMFFEVIGIFFGNFFFWVFILSIYGVGIILLSFIFYFSHESQDDENYQVIAWKLNLKTVFWVLKLVWNVCRGKNMKPWKENFRISKLILIIILLLLNFSFLLLGAIVQPGWKIF